MLRAALLQITGSDDPAENLATLEPMIAEAAGAGAALVLTPEVSNLVSMSRKLQWARLRAETEDPVLSGLRAAAQRHRVWLSVGSLALLAEDGERFVNRQFLVDSEGEVRARYDKIHMFDVELEGGESYRESTAYRPGERAVVADTPWGRLGLTICYDMRFPALYRALALAGASILTVPSAFTVPTGRKHWEVLLRSRAIETGAFVLAAAQWGEHPASEGKQRRTWGHSLAVAPDGRVLADAGEGTGVTLVDLDLAEVEAAHRAIPSLANARNFAGP